MLLSPTHCSLKNAICRGMTAILATDTADEICGLLNDATDYVVTFLPKSTHTPAALESLWQRRFDFGKGVHACGLNTSSGLVGTPDSRE